ncbi:MAG: HAD family hydrolase [Ruminococcaceae bacterium]|nr:HAD family hydrolase [Oscillospiraceae bacterium]
MNHPCRHFIFDLDGTLAYTIGDLTASINRMCLHFGWPSITEEDALRNINFGARAFVRGCMPTELCEDEEAVDRAFRVYSDMYATAYLNTTCLYPGVAEGIAYLKEQGAKLAVFSNKQDAQTKAICEKLFPADTFCLVWGHSGAYPHKPSPEGALAIAEQFGVRPEEIILVGDSDVDMMLAARAGMHPVGVSWGYRPAAMLQTLGAETIVHSLDDLKNLLSCVVG